MDLPIGVERTEEPSMTKTIHGKIHGKTIELDEDLGDGCAGLFERRELNIQHRRTFVTLDTI